MTEPDERLPRGGTGQPGGEHDLEAAEEFAESAPIDPSPDEVNHYLNLVGDPDAEPEQVDPEPLDAQPLDPTKG